jgi:hypothetical protein
MIRSEEMKETRGKRYHRSRSDSIWIFDKWGCLDDVKPASDSLTRPGTESQIADLPVAHKQYYVRPTLK